MYDRNCYSGSCGRKNAAKFYPCCGHEANCGRKDTLQPQEATSATIFHVKYSHKGQNFGCKIHLRLELAAICLAAKIEVAAAMWTL